MILKTELHCNDDCVCISLIHSTNTYWILTILCFHMLCETYKISAIMAIGDKEETENKQNEWKNIRELEALHWIGQTLSDQSRKPLIPVASLNIFSELVYHWVVHCPHTHQGHTEGSPSGPQHSSIPTLSSDRLFPGLLHVSPSRWAMS